MINDFRDFCTWAYTLIDDLYQQLAPFYLSSRPGPSVKGGSDNHGFLHFSTTTSPVVLAQASKAVVIAS